MRRFPAAFFLPLVLLPLSCAVPEPTNPEFATAAEAEVDPGELVIGIQMEGEVKAYPISAMAPLEILNDEIGGVPVAVTWCPLSASSAVLSRRTGERVHWFRFHEDLYLMNLLVFDAETKSVWSQLAMRAVEGELEETPLELLPSLHTTWEHWRSLHPETLVMKPIWGHRDFEYRDPGEPGPDGLGERSLVHVVPLEEEIRAYPLDALAEAQGLWVDRTGEEEIILRLYQSGPGAWAQDPEGALLPGITLYRSFVDDFYPGAVWPMAAGGPEGTG